MNLDETINHYLLYVESRRYSIHTQIGYRHHLFVMSRLLADLCHVTDLEQVTVFNLRQCVQHLLNAPVEIKKARRPDNGLTLSTVSVGVYMRRWKTFFSWCFKEELLEKNPSVRLEFPKVDEKIIDTFSADQLQEMLSSFDFSMPHGFRDYVMIVLMLDTGIRRAELVGLRVEDIHDTYISVFGKGRKERQVGIHPKTGNLLWKYIHKYRHPANENEPALFLAVGKRYSGTALTRGGMDGLIRRLKAATGIDEVRLSAHTFRHTFAAMYLDEGGDLFSLSREMGHSDIKTTERYLKSFTSKNARMHHTGHSPINRINLRSQHKGKGQNKKSKE